MTIDSGRGRVRAAVVVLFGLGAALGAASARADPATRLADLLAGTGNGVPEVHAAVFQGKLYFRATDDGTNFDLWVHDGVNPPAIVPGGEGIDPLDPVVWQGALYFGGTDGSDRELWRFNGVDAPEEAYDLYGSGSGSPRNLFAWDAAGLLCYQVNTGAGVELGCWDGVGTPSVWPLAAGSASGNPIDFAVLGDRLVFGASSSNLSSSRRLFAFDGQSAPTIVTADGTHPGNPHEMTVAEGVVYFWASAPGTSSARVWRWDGTVAPPEPFGPAGISFPGAMVLWRGRPHLYIGQGAYGIWRVDTDGLTRLTNQSLSGGARLDATVAGDAIYLIEDTSEGWNVDLHRFCGSESLPNVTEQFSLMTDGVVKSRTVEFAGRLYFAAFDAAAGAELWSIPLSNLFCDGFVDENFDFWTSAVP